MDPLTISGVILGFGAILFGNFMEGGHLDTLVNGPAMIIVFGGTFGAVLLQTPLVVFTHSMKTIKCVLIPKKIDLQMDIDKVIEWSSLARKEGLLGLEALLLEESDPFAKKGLQLLVDGNEPETIRDVLEVELGVKEDNDLQAAKVFEAMGGYSPTIGIIGAVMGLIHVMQNLSDPSKLGSGIATAFIATIYGVGLANLLFLPIASKMKAQAKVLSKSRELMLEGVSGIAEGENPKNIETKLDGFLQ